MLKIVTIKAKAMPEIAHTYQEDRQMFPTPRAAHEFYLAQKEGNTPTETPKPVQSAMQRQTQLIDELTRTREEALLRTQGLKR